MASEAQRLIGISLTKIAQSRAHRGGASLHRNLLVATVLQKARFIFLQENVALLVGQPHQQQQQVQMHPLPASAISSVPPHHLGRPQLRQDEPAAAADSDRCAQDAAAALTSGAQEAHSQSQPLAQDYLPPACAKCAQHQQRDKENRPPDRHSEHPTCPDAERGPSVLRERIAAGANGSTLTCLKRRRAVSEWETEEAVQSILPKRRCSVAPDDADFLDNATALLSKAVSRELEDAASATTHAGANAMEIDRITSLVSIFSFGMSDASGTGSKPATASGMKAAASRAVSTPDLCSAQAKESDAMQQRPFLAMTV